MGTSRRPERTSWLMLFDGEDAASEAEGSAFLTCTCDVFSGGFERLDMSVLYSLARTKQLILYN